MDVGLVCDTCSTFNPIGTPKCSRCGAALSLDKRKNDEPSPRREPAPKPPAPPAGLRPGPQHGDLEETIAGVGNAQPPAQPPAQAQAQAKPRVPTGGGTRSRMAPPPLPDSVPKVPQEGPRQRSAKQTMLFGAMQEAHAKLVLIKGGGMAGVSFTLAGDEHLMGRTGTPILFEDDPFLSPVHANFLFRFGTLLVRDEGSVNGVYIRIQGEVPISFGDRFLVGEQVLEVQPTPDSLVPEPIDDGTYFFASPRRPSHFRVVQRLLGGDTGLAFRALSPVVSVGREGNDIDFPEDPFISGRHAKLALRNNQLTLTDLDSKNGTFLRINGEYPLKHGDYVFMGQQLLRVEIV